MFGTTKFSCNHLIFFSLIRQSNCLQIDCKTEKIFAFCYLFSALSVISKFVYKPSKIWQQRCSVLEQTDARTKAAESMVGVNLESENSVYLHNGISRVRTHTQPNEKVFPHSQASGQVQPNNLQYIKVYNFFYLFSSQSINMLMRKRQTCQGMRDWYPNKLEGV